MTLLIMMAILFPVFSKAKAKAKETVCLSNLHQEYLAVKLYEGDWDALPSYMSNDPVWIKGYTGGVRLACPKAFGGQRDYDIVAGPFLDTSTEYMRHLNKMLADCREARGPDFPYVIDKNHLQETENYQGLGAGVILIRASGAAKWIRWHGGPYPGTKEENEPWPCRELGRTLGAEMSY
jgi:hypothetical protein